MVKSQSLYSSSATAARCWRLLSMVYVLCRIVGQWEPTQMVKLEGTDDEARTDFVKKAARVLDATCADDASGVKIYSAAGEPLSIYGCDHGWQHAICCLPW